MTTYRVVISKVLEDGKTVEEFHDSGPGWYISPWLRRLANKLYEPIPSQPIEGQRELFPRAA